MAIWLHSYISSGKRYIQVESQPSHITGIFRRLIHLEENTQDVKNVCFECEEDGTTTFYQAAKANFSQSGLWTYLVYQCLEGEEKVILDSSISTSAIPLLQLLTGQKLVQETIDIDEYLKYQSLQDDYLEVQLPKKWKTREGKAIADLLLEEQKAFKLSSVFAEHTGTEYMKAVLNGFIEAAKKILARGGTLRDFELAQYEVLKRIKIDDMANLILESNDYRIWPSALPSQSKAVEYAFHKALTLIVSC
ncbi:hypothetical protein WA1_37160 [Scytonema hofmannii PCC 7110]|uniref:Uncharacterized protein n=1 Tax=Scytonema hofmannii PCC 7110 TaxID=128403 RepID=A0A139X176_9CYAN|nr:hypothetical protein [Scytonema hofmannii]KYC38410.1 hypothetical protein WA1_37160 [Scytonema hofmannii PCC 7110]